MQLIAHALCAVRPATAGVGPASARRLRSMMYGNSVLAALNPTFALFSVRCLQQIAAAGFPAYGNPSGTGTYVGALQFAVFFQLSFIFIDVFVRCSLHKQRWVRHNRAISFVNLLCGVQRSPKLRRARYHRVVQCEPHHTEH